MFINTKDYNQDNYRIYEKNYSHRGAGFTLIEIAIVIAIIGILILGISGGRGLLENSKIKSIKNQFDKIATAIYVYQDRFNAFPGDDSLANIHIKGNVAASNSLDNGFIDSAWDSKNIQDESRLIWQHLRLADLLDGSDTYFPKNKFSGIIGIQNNIYNFNSNAICFSKIPGKAALEYEIKYDNGSNNNAISSGRVRAGLSGEYQEDTHYILCIKI